MYEQLREGQPFYICSNTGPWLFAPFKVAWKTMAAPLQATVITPSGESPDTLKPALFKNTFVFVPMDDQTEAHYVCACLNSSCADLAARSYSVGKSFGSPHLLQQVAVPKYVAANPAQIKLARLSQRAHELAARIASNPQDEGAKRELAEVDDQVDRAAAQLWGLTDSDLEEIRKALALLS